jgi:O-antigen/teichoic acid export membrane protein
VTPVSNAFGQVILPRLAGAHGSEDAAERLCATSRIASGINVLMGLGFLLISPLAVSIVFGASFAPAIPATMVLVVAAVCLGMNQFLEEAVRGLGRPGLATVAELCGFAVTAVGLAVLLPRFGILGAALASLLSYTTVLIMLVVILHRRLGLRPRDLLLPRPADVRSCWTDSVRREPNRSVARVHGWTGRPRRLTLQT